MEDDDDDLTGRMVDNSWANFFASQLEDSVINGEPSSSEDPIGIMAAMRSRRENNGDVPSPTITRVSTPTGRSLPYDLPSRPFLRQPMDNMLVQADMAELEQRVTAHMQQAIDDEVNNLINDERVEPSEQAEQLRRAMLTVGQSTITAEEAMRQFGQVASHIGVDLAASPDRTETVSLHSSHEAVSFTIRQLEDKVAELDLTVSQQRLAIAELQVENKQLKDSVRTILKGKHPQQRRVKINRKKGSK